MPKTAETSSIPMVELREDAVFLGPDDTALTDFGMKLQKLVRHHHTLIQKSRNGTASQLKITDGGMEIMLKEQEDLCRQTGIDPYLIGIVSNQFFQMANKRLNAMGKNFFNDFRSNGNNGDNK